MNVSRQGIAIRAMGTCESLLGVRCMADSKIILASFSPRRKRILLSMGVHFEVHQPHCHEATLSEDPTGTVGFNAKQKWNSVHRRHPNSCIIAADTVVAYQGRIYGKPKDYNDGVQMLMTFAGNRVNVFTGVAINRPRHRPDLFIEAASVRFHALTEAEAKTYMNQVNPLDRAGAFDINESSELIVRDIIGSKSTVMGLPRKLLRNWFLANLPLAMPIDA